MARKRMHHVCIKTGDIPGSTMLVKTLCGQGWSNQVSDDLAKVTCPTCNTKKAKKLLKAHPALKLGKFERDRYGEYRSLYPILYHDSLVGYITMKQGWGNAWRVKPIGISIHGVPNPTKDGGTGPFYSKEAALLAAPQLLAEGKLRRLDQVKAELAQQTAEQARANKERAEREGEREGKRNEMLADLQSILDQKELSDRQFDALHKAIVIVANSPTSAFKS
jgi:hypothetical protein